MNVIEVNDVTKIYKLYDNPMDRFKEAIHPFHKQYSTPFYALRNVSFHVEKGETVGIIGTNGSGKSTILKMITGVIQPSEGSINVDGKVSALLELGAGFDMDYSGVENIYMNGAVLGFSREEMDLKKDEILEFADIGDFVYQPVKTYSSGMLVRLAFALAINVEPEILIIDEALAVGDAFFQAKCFNKLEEIKASGTTILFVSHDIVSVKKLCSRAVWIEKGVLQEVGPAGEVCERYMSAQIIRNNAQNHKLLLQMGTEDNKYVQLVEKAVCNLPKLDLEKAEAITSNGKAELLSFYITDSNGELTNIIKPEKEYRYAIVAKFHEELEHIIFGFELENLKGIRVFGINNFMQGKHIGYVNTDNIYEVSFKLSLPKLHKGEYLVTPAVSAGTQDNHVVLMRAHNCQTVIIDNESFNIALLELDAVTEIREFKSTDINIR